MVNVGAVELVIVLLSGLLMLVPGATLVMTILIYLKVKRLEEALQHRD